MELSEIQTEELVPKDPRVGSPGPKGWFPKSQHLSGIHMNTCTVFTDGFHYNSRLHQMEVETSQAMKDGQSPVLSIHRIQ